MLDNSQRQVVTREQLVNQIQAILVNRDVQTDAIQVEMSTQMDPIKESKEVQVGCQPKEFKATQTESRIEEIKVQQLAEHGQLEKALTGQQVTT